VQEPLSHGPAADLAGFARGILVGGRLSDKLAPPPARWLESGFDLPPRPPIPIVWPARAPGLELGDGAAALPRPGSLQRPDLRAECLARFAHHELMAVELFAWALLRWPRVPGAVQRDWLRALADEQRHCRMYLERLAAHGARLEQFAPHSGYFWRQGAAIAESPHGPRAFLAAMGLTLEQANLDFTLVYRDAFRAVGDEASARVCERVHDDEIGHVRSAARWLAALSPEESDCDLVRLYEATVPFPLSAARAKGRRFDAAARRRAGLDESFIEHVRRARSSQEARPRSRGAPD